MHYTYMLTNRHNTVLYIGVTNNLVRRTYEHRNKLLEGFTKRYNLTKLVYFEAVEDIMVAIAREKQLKGWTRAKKERLIATMNPQWNDLWPMITR